MFYKKQERRTGVFTYTEKIMKIALCGLGRAGGAFAGQILDSSQHQLSLVVCRDESDTAGRDVGDVLGRGKTGKTIIRLKDASEALKESGAGVLVDFSREATTMKLLKLCEDAEVNIVICATEFTDSQMDEIRATGERGKIAVCYAPNLTIGINILMQMTKRLSKLLPDFDLVIVERHRKDKAPVTATAKLIARSAEREDIPILSVRAGGYVGIHEVTAASRDERITITHESFSRTAFGTGALAAAEFLRGRKGFFTMDDVIKDLEVSI